MDIDIGQRDLVLRLYGEGFFHRLFVCIPLCDRGDLVHDLVIKALGVCCVGAFVGGYFEAYLCGIARRMVADYFGIGCCVSLDALIEGGFDVIDED